ncbi:hypothetical protein CEXT_73521 [Caerostris extrusa]|uniref:Uncharacterized protein n=1 Tax=Caerostris extrusa TaxID=172846 RepID=A0AAV4MLS4_CAEEX|nr:hypothetical protein CEXT_73521 [Caerostris extrusa]
MAMSMVQHGYTMVQHGHVYGPTCGNTHPPPNTVGVWRVRNSCTLPPGSEAAFLKPFFRNISRSENSSFGLFSG